MTGAEWENCQDVHQMLGFLKNRVSNRRLRLLACATWRAVWWEIPEGPAREAVVVAERYADGLATSAELAEAARAAEGERDSRDGAVAGFYAAAPSAWQAARLCVGMTRLVLLGLRNGADVNGLQCGLVRCLVGHPSRPARVEHTWRARNEGAVRRLAEVIYSGRELPSGRLDVAQLAILGDALEEGGCGDRGLLDHLRADAPHVLGCHTVDACLGRV